MNKLFSGKRLLIVCLVLSLVLLCAGAFVFGFLGFNQDSTTKDPVSVEVSGAIPSLTEEARGSLLDFCKDYITEEGYTVSSVRYDSDTSLLNGTLAFRLAVSAEKAEEGALEALADGLEDAVSALTEEQVAGIELVREEISVVSTVRESIPMKSYVWRTAVAGAVVLVIAFAYTAIRFRPGMGLTVLAAGVHDVLLTLALVALFRLPVGVTLLAVAAFSLLTSLLFNLSVCGRIRADLRKEEWKELSAQEAVSRSLGESVRTVGKGAAALAVFCIVIGVVGAVLGIDLAFAMVGGLIAVVVSAYSALLFAPSLFVRIKARTDARKAERARYDYVPEKERKKREKEKAQQEAASAEE